MKPTVGAFQCEHCTGLQPADIFVGGKLLYLVVTPNY